METRLLDTGKGDHLFRSHAHSYVTELYAEPRFIAKAHAEAVGSVSRRTPQNISPECGMRTRSCCWFVSARRISTSLMSRAPQSPTHWMWKMPSTRPARPGMYLQGNLSMDGDKGWATYPPGPLTRFACRSPCDSIHGRNRAKGNPRRLLCSAPPSETQAHTVLHCTEPRFLGIRVSSSGRSGPLSPPSPRCRPAEHTSRVAWNGP